jgi:hypothetical protein
MNIKLGGWQAVVAIVVVIIIAGIRFVTFQDKINDRNLMDTLKTQIVSDYLPAETAKLQEATNSGDSNRISEVAESVTRAQPKIESVKISSPLFSFSSSGDVVVRVVYSLAEGSKTRDRKTLYLLYSYGAVGNTWSFKHKTTTLKYYLNFK